jgi:CDP-diacylglycerol--serine O-phosphatidyltransferase
MSKFRFKGGKNRRVHNQSGLLNSDSIPLRAIVPNLITAFAACAGITSISLSSEGRFIPALWALFFAAICDGIDGRVARLLNASSKLGAELDSLADFVNFGVAPAMFMYYWMTGGPQHILPDGAVVSSAYIRIVLGCALYYAMCDCFRLARFNTMLEQPSKPYWKHFFTGVPAPGGCWMVLTPAILSVAFEAKTVSPTFALILQNPWTGVFMLLFVGSLMASRLPTISLKAIHVSRKFMPLVMAALLLLISCLFINFWMTLGIVGTLYILTVPITAIAFTKVRSSYMQKLDE